MLNSAKKTQKLITSYCITANNKTQAQRAYSRKTRIKTSIFNLFGPISTLLREHIPEKQGLRL